jgi:monoamine oxidase
MLALQEMYDHSTFDNTGFALKVLNGGSHTLTLAERQEKVIKTTNFLLKMHEKRTKTPTTFLSQNEA